MEGLFVRRSLRALLRVAFISFVSASYADGTGLPMTGPDSPDTTPQSNGQNGNLIT